MKIKFKVNFCNYKVGEITDALILKDGNAWVLDQNDSIQIQYAFKADFDIVVEEQPNDIVVEEQPKQSVMSLRDLLGQGVKSLEFK